VLYREVQPGLLRYLRGMVGADAEDLAAETWVQIARDIRSYPGHGRAGDPDAVDRRDGRVHRDPAEGPGGGRAAAGDRGAGRSYRSRRLDRSTAERLLTGDQATTDTNADTAIAMLAMALRAALAAYSRPAQLGPVPETRRPSMFKSALLGARKGSVVMSVLYRLTGRGLSVSAG
jgi:hypothetical protein